MIREWKSPKIKTPFKFACIFVGMLKYAGRYKVILVYYILLPFLIIFLCIATTKHVGGI